MIFCSKGQRKEVKSEWRFCFDNMAVGERTLAEKMKHISKEAELLRVYTNHSIRATPITALETCGCEARHIIADHDSGHKSESSIQSYYKTDTDTKIIDIVYVNFLNFAQRLNEDQDFKK